jgi:hypothetical protein
MPPSRWASVDYTLDWPRELLADELEALIADSDTRWRPGPFAELLREAFDRPEPVRDFERVSRGDEWISGVRGPKPGQAWVLDLLEHLPELRPRRPPTPLWRARQAGSLPAFDPEDPKEAVAELLRVLDERGYFAKRFPRDCVDAEPDEWGDGVHLDPPDARIRRYLVQTTSHGGREIELWPAFAGWRFWTDETLYEVIEALHDVVARPRQREHHAERECGWHYSDFDTDAGRRIYRALINRLLAERGVELCLADAGEDEGRLVRVTDESRSELIERALSSPDSEAAAEVQHAVSLFRRREATLHDKRSAVVALQRILEKRRRLLKTALFSDDEGALFHIANRFDLRHSNADQHTDYDPAFFDWVFWWYLATIELTDRLLARQGTAEDMA